MICMHLPSVTCPNCDPARAQSRWNSWGELPDYQPPRRETLPHVGDPPESGICMIQGHDYAVGQTHAICNRCKDVVKLT